MAKPGYFSDMNSYSAGRNFLDLQWTSGASGAVPTVFDRGVPGPFVSVAHGATGVYVVTLSDVWADMLVFKQWIRQATYSASGACNARMTADGSQNATPTITLLITNAAGAAVEPAAGDVIYINLEVQSYSPGTGL